MDGVQFSASVTFFAPAAIIATVLALARREWRLFRAPQTDDFDPFPYTTFRFVRRMAGLAVLLGLALTLASLGRWPPQTAVLATRYFALLTGELALLGVVVVGDLWALAVTPPRGNPRSARR